MKNRALFLSLISLSICAGDVPPSPGNAYMVNQNPDKPIQMPPINPQYPQNTPASNGVGSSAASGLVGLLVDAMNMKEPDISKEKWLAQRNEAIFQADLAKHGDCDAMRQIWPEKFVDKNPVYGFGGTPKLLVGLPNPDAPIFVSTPTPPAPIVADPVVAISTPIVNPLPTPPVTVPTSTPNKFTIHDSNKVPSLKDMAAPRHMPIPQAPDRSFEAPATYMPEGPSVGDMLKGAGEAAAVVIVTAAVGYAAYKTGEYTVKGAKWLGKKLFGSAEQQIVAHVPNPLHNPNLPDFLQSAPNPLSKGIKPYQPAPKSGQGDTPHGYGDRWGHYLEYTQENVNAVLESINKGVYHGQNPRSGSHVFTYQCPKTGLQKWAYTDNNGAILNCGINPVAHTVCPDTKQLLAPQGFKKPEGKGFGWKENHTSMGTGMKFYTTDYEGSLQRICNGRVNVLKLPTPPCDVPCPTFQDHMQARAETERAIGVTLVEYYMRLNPTMPHEQKMEEMRKARKFLKSLGSNNL